jgi:hypothetical protein
VLHGLGDKASLAVLPNNTLWAAGTVALEIEARLRTDSLNSYGVSPGEMIRLYTGWNAYLNLVADKWYFDPLIRGGANRLLASPTVVKPYWTYGTDLHLRVVLDNTRCRVWINQRLAATTATPGDLNLFNRTGNSTFSLGQFTGSYDEVTIKRHTTTVPDYPDLSPPFHITEMHRQLRLDGEGNDIDVRWNSQPGQEYTLETSADLVHWTPWVNSVMTATELSTLLPVQVVDASHHFVRVKHGNSFAGLGPLLLNLVDGDALKATSQTIQWFGNTPGVTDWQVTAGSVPGATDYFQSLILPGTSNQYPISGLPTHGGPVHVALRYRVGSTAAWQEKRFTFTAMQTSGLPAEREGGFPVHMPALAGIDQILVLNNRWVIAAVVDIPEVVGRINTMTNGNYQTQLDRWAISQPAGNSPDWGAYSGLQQMRDDNIAAARTFLNEGRYVQPSFYSITSSDDGNYSTGRSPSVATQNLVGLNKAELPGSPIMHYAHYCYLQLPDAMVNGKHYTVTLSNGKAATFLYDESYTVSRAIKVNQAGYLPGCATKYAYMGAHVYGFGPLPLGHATSFEVVDAQTGTVVLTGTPTLREANPRFQTTTNSPDPLTRPFMHGEDLYQMDLSGLTATGNFFLRVPGVGRSWTFRHAVDAYAEPYYLCMRGMFHQRASMAYQMPFTPWSRIRAHKDPVYESDQICFGFGEFYPPNPYERFDVVGGTIKYDQYTTGVIGGWYDAADWDRNLRHYTNIFDMLYAYELAPGKFADSQLNLPESGNGIPDILDEAEWGLDCWTRSMNAQGGVSGMIETWTHPTMTDATYKYAFSKRTRWSSLLYAAAAAQLAELVMPYDATRSARYRELALRAYAYGANAANSLGTFTAVARTDRGAGTPYNVTWTEQAQFNEPYLFHAKLRLHYLTQDPSYLTNIQSHLSYGATPWSWPNTLKDCVPWFYYSIAKRGTGIFPQTLIDSWRNRFISAAENMVNLTGAMGYRHAWYRHQDYWMAWGESDMANRARVLLQGYALTQDNRYRDAAALNMDYMFGCNPMGISWTTGVGFTYPCVLQHAVSELDGIDDPVPGLTLYGIDGGPIFHQVRSNVWKSPTAYNATTYTEFYPDPETPFYRRWVPHPTANVGQCEFTVHETMSAQLFCCAMLLPDSGGAWTPPTSLVQRKPRHKSQLFGYWHLP